MPSTIDIPTPNEFITVDRARLRTAMRLYRDGVTGRRLHGTLKADYEVEHYEAMRLAVAARFAVDLGIEP